MLESLNRKKLECGKGVLSYFMARRVLHLQLESSKEPHEEKSVRKENSSEVEGGKTAFSAFSGFSACSMFSAFS
jgi:hypothetical protein